MTMTVKLIILVFLLVGGIGGIVYVNKSSDDSDKKKNK